MRILHTSDWHLGRSFHRVGLLDAQAAFVDHLVDVVRTEQVDTVLVSGDVYDRALPSVDAVQLASETLHRLAALGVRVVVISGNHDSGPRLGFASSLIDAAGIHLRTDPRRVDDPIVLTDPHGDVAIYAIPYLEPDLVASAWGLAERSHQAALDEAVRRIHLHRSVHAASDRAVVLSHAFVTGARPSDSERDISVGGIDNVAVDTFAGFDYAALGHLHGRQALADGIRYSGSPLAYSFSEAEHVKGTWLVDLDSSGLASAEFVAAPVPRRLGQIRGTLPQILTDPRHAGLEDAWLQVTLTDVERPKRAMEQVQQRFPHTLALAYEPPPGTRPPSAASLGSLARRSDTEVVSGFFSDVARRAIAPAEAHLVATAFDACRVAADAAAS